MVASRWRREAAFRWSGWGDTADHGAEGALVGEQADGERGRERGHGGVADGGGRGGGGGGGGTKRRQEALEAQSEVDPLVCDGLQVALWRWVRRGAGVGRGRQDGAALLGSQRGTDTEHKRPVDTGRGEDSRVNQRKAKQGVNSTHELNVCH